MTKLTHKSYSGRRTPEGITVVEVIDSGQRRPLDPRYDLHNHSRGFEWGYAGSGPAQLALAIAADLLGDDDQAMAIYQRLKFKVIGRLGHDSWHLTDDHLCEAIAEIMVAKQEQDA